MERLIVTTSLGMNAALVTRAKALAQDLAVPYQARDKWSISKFLQIYSQVLLVDKEGLCLVQSDGSRLRFHPDTAMLRIKSPRDPLMELVGEAPQQVLDLTMGLASDSLVMSYAGHDVTALESQPLIHLIVAEGLKTLVTGHVALDAAMRRIQPLQTEALAYLQAQEAQSVDVIYADPMFSETISESQNLSGLVQLANPARFSAAILTQAKRVARKKIIIKAHFRDPIFEELGFERLVRPNQKFHFGVIRC